MATFKMGKMQKSRIVKFYRVEMTTRYKDGTDVDLLSTRYAMNASEKKRAIKKVEDINTKYHPDTYRPKYKNRFTTIQARSAKLVIVPEEMAGIPVYL